VARPRPVEPGFVTLEMSFPSSRLYGTEISAMVAETHDLSTMRVPHQRKIPLKILSLLHVSKVRYPNPPPPRLTFEQLRLTPRDAPRAPSR
jgi:hypothetical protein